MGEIGEGTPVTSSIRLIRRLGEGGMGSVWLARHDGLGADVVVKFLADRLAEDPTSRARFSHEASAAARVRSPHVVQMLDHGVTDDGHPYIVMELLEGNDLGRALKKRKQLPPDEVAHIVEHVALALSKAHKNAIIHRDIKPSNVFLCDVGTPRPFVKLVDFGIAAGDWDHLTTTGHAIGTPAYMSPEQLSGATVDYRSDLWSLGVVAFRALTGSVPFDRPTPAELMGAILHAPMPIPSKRAPELSRQIDEWFRRACARDPLARFASAMEMAEALWAAVGVPKALASTPSNSQPLSVEAGAELPATEVLTDGTLRSQVHDSEDFGARRRRSVVLGVAFGGLLFCIGVIATYFALEPAPVSSAVVLGAPSVRAALASAASRASPSSAPPAPKPPASSTPATSATAKPARGHEPHAIPRAKSPVDDVSDLGF